MMMMMMVVRLMLILYQRDLGLDSTDSFSQASVAHPAFALTLIMMRIHHDDDADDDDDVDDDQVQERCADVFQDEKQIGAKAAFSMDFKHSP